MVTLLVSVPSPGPSAFWIICVAWPICFRNSGRLSVMEKIWLEKVGTVWRKAQKNGLLRVTSSPAHANCHSPFRISLLCCPPSPICSNFAIVSMTCVLSSVFSVWPRLERLQRFRSSARRASVAVAVPMPDEVAMAIAHRSVSPAPIGKARGFRAGDCAARLKRKLANTVATAPSSRAAKAPAPAALKRADRRALGSSAMSLMRGIPSAVPLIVTAMGPGPGIRWDVRPSLNARAPGVGRAWMVGTLGAV
mmetsp:Transcript_38007/g.63147  ORF Transcript_38007/g.63147 Transcript_38007/m.63147 type:complete len:250 (-) Transcript_38007:157-906(-)